jgi:hypothetical protein
VVKRRVISHKRAARVKGAEIIERSDKSQKPESQEPDSEQHSRWISLAEKALAADRSCDKKSD